MEALDGVKARRRAYVKKCIHLVSGGTDEVYFPEPSEPSATNAVGSNLGEGTKAANGLGGMCGEQRNAQDLHRLILREGHGSRVSAAEAEVVGPESCAA